MAKHEVACVACGRMFDAEQGGKYNPKTRRYTCPECAQRLYAEALAARTKKVKRSFAIKMIIGILSLIVGISNGGAALLGGLIVGLPLIAWAVVPLAVVWARHKNELED